LEKIFEKPMCEIIHFYTKGIILQVPPNELSFLQTKNNGTEKKKYISVLWYRPADLYV